MHTVHALSAALLLTPFASAQDTGFLRGKGRTDVALSYATDTYDEFWVGHTKVSDPGVGEIERATVNLYLAHGLTDELDVVFNAAYADVSSDGSAGFSDESDPQDMVLGAKWRCYRRPVGSGEVSLFLTPAVKVPLDDYENNAVTALGDGQVDLRLRGIAHLQVGAWWLSLENGFDRRNGAPDDEYPLNVTLGGNLGPVTLMPFYSGVASQGGIDISDVPALGGFPATEEEYERYGVRAYARWNEHFGLTAGYLETADGQNTGDVSAWSLGLVYRL
jgi:hypothetical protein